VHDAVIEWFDSHCHLQDEFAPSAEATEKGAHANRLTATIARAAEAGVTRMVCVGTGAGSSSEAVRLVRAMRRPDSVAVAEGVELWATVGLHPHDAVDGVDSLESLLTAELASGGREGTTHGATGPRGTAERVVVGIGECGLDYHYDHSPRPVQREAFARQIELANRHDLTLVVHTREAWDDTWDILQATGVPERTVIHCFTGGPVEARKCLDLGTSLSFSGVVTFKNAADVREAAALCPMDRLLVETDTPFLTPVPHRGTLNEPSRVPLVGAAVAQVKEVETLELARASTQNARAMFSL
jgi:TatD DNase family protein